MNIKAAILQQFRKIPSVGKTVAEDLYNMGYRSVADFKGEDPDMMYIRHNDRKGKVQDICMLYTFRSIVYYADTLGGAQDPEKLKWWNWKDKVKITSKNKDAQIRMKKGLR